MKILATGDIHGDISLVKRLAEKADKENVDVIILSGDNFKSDIETENVVGEFLKKNKSVFIIPGNHDTVATVKSIVDIYGVRNLHGYSVKYKDIGLGIFGCGGAEIGPHPTPDSEIFDLLHKGFDKIKEMKKKIMVTHVHPKGSKFSHFSQFDVIKESESEAVRKAILEFKPDIAICAHVHEGGGIEDKIGDTRVVNVSKQGFIFDV